MTKPTEIARTDNVPFVASITGEISPVSFHELRLATPDGEPASLAMIDM
ncbi:hypothetical protein [Burkholderia sp. S-53]|nr:hypothetical protein [Burkholderia sp. S-53]UXU86376.1 hypothetical protein LXM88_14415 [Burkholderia sp. S-53]